MTRHIILTVLLSAFSIAVFAWDGSGHMTCGAIAYYYLKENNPATLSKVLATLKLHPWYFMTWADKTAGMTAEEKDIALFMLASTYADDARSNPDLGGGAKSQWHYVDYPYAAEEGIPTESPKSPNAEEKIVEFIASIPKEAETSEKAVDLAWLFHLVEDIHQPLHTVSMFDTNRPKGDRGGNDTYIRFDSIQESVKLHSYWDRLVKGTMKNIPEHAERFLHNDSTAQGELSDIPHVWIMQSFDLAVKQTYGNGKVLGTKTNPTYVTKDYSKVAKAIGEHQVYLAGVRLAKTLITIYK